MALSPPEEREAKLVKTGFERWTERIKEFWHEYKQEKVGLLGIVLLVFVAIWGITGNLFGDTDDTMYSGDSPRAAAPVWAMRFSDNAFRDQTLIDQNFGTVTGRTYELSKAKTPNNKEWEKRRVEVTAEEYLHATTFIDDHHLKFRLKDSGKPFREKSPRSINATMVVSKPFNWEKGRAPNNYIFHFDYKYKSFGIPKNSLYGRDPDYSFGLASYIKAKDISVTNMVNILKESGHPLTESDYKRPYGIRWTTTTSQRQHTTWTRKPKETSLGRMMTIFTTFDQLEINFVVRLQIEEQNLKQRSAGVFSISMDNVKLVGRGYFSGLAGTTAYGGDLYSLIAMGMVNDLLLGLTATSITLFLGIVFGLVAGYYRGRVDEIIMRVVDFLLVLPTLPILIVLSYVFVESGIPRTWGVVVSISFIGWAGLARFLRSQVLSERERPYVEAARASGATDFRIIFGHILPNIIGIIMYQVVLRLQTVILLVAGLSFLGLGPQYVSFGILLQQLTQVSLQGGGPPSPTLQGASMLDVWWFSLFPGLLLFLFGTGLIFIGMTFQKIIGERT